MAKTATSPSPEITTTTSTETSRSVPFWEKYNKPIIYIGGLIILLAGAWIGYREMVVKPREVKANEMLFAAENLFGKMAASGFNKDSSVVVLNGGPMEEQNVTGVLKVISSYGGTAAGNRARYIAGATYLHLKEFDKAISFLKDFRGNGAHQAESKAYVMLGHAYAEKNNVNEALNYYKKAANVNRKDETVTPDALYLAASYADTQGKTDEASKLYRELKDNFPSFTAVRSGEVDKYLARLGEFK